MAWRNDISRVAPNGLNRLRIVVKIQEECYWYTNIKKILLLFKIKQNIEPTRYSGQLIFACSSSVDRLHNHSRLGASLCSHSNSSSRPSPNSPCIQAQSRCSSRHRAKQTSSSIRVSWCAYLLILQRMPTYNNNVLVSVFLALDGTASVTVDVSVHRRFLASSGMGTSNSSTVIVAVLLLLFSMAANLPVRSWRFSRMWSCLWCIFFGQRCDRLWIEVVLKNVLKIKCFKST